MTEPTVTLTLKEFDAMREDIKSLKAYRDKLEQAIQRVTGRKINEFLEMAGDYLRKDDVKNYRRMQGIEL